MERDEVIHEAREFVNLIRPELALAAKSMLTGVQYQGEVIKKAYLYHGPTQN